jgi:uncharacterized damage-inducible protein DinB
MSVTATLPHSFLATGGQDIDLFPVSSSDLTVAQAANFLRTSEKHLNHLLEVGRISSRLENGERFISQDSLLGFEQEQETRHAELDELFSMFQEAGMSDDDE